LRYPPYGPRVEEYGRHHDTAAWWFGHAVGLILAVALITLLVVLALRLLNRTSLAAPVVAASGAAPPPPSEDAALAQLRLRYANGDVSRDDYLRIASDLGASVPSSSPPAPPSSGTD
jgi:uncharacterized membrane protein